MVYWGWDHRNLTICVDTNGVRMFLSTSRPWCQYQDYYLISYFVPLSKPFFSEMSFLPEICAQGYPYTKFLDSSISLRLSTISGVIYEKLTKSMNPKMLTLSDKDCRDILFVHTICWWSLVVDWNIRLATKYAVAECVYLPTFGL